MPNKPDVLTINLRTAKVRPFRSAEALFVYLAEEQAHWTGIFGPSLGLLKNQQNSFRIINYQPAIVRIQKSLEAGAPLQEVNLIAAFQDSGTNFLPPRTSAPALMAEGLMEIGFTEAAQCVCLAFSVAEGLFRKGHWPDHDIQTNNQLNLGLSLMLADYAKKPVSFAAQAKAQADLAQIKISTILTAAEEAGSALSTEIASLEKSSVESERRVTRIEDSVRRLSKRGLSAANAFIETAREEWEKRFEDAYLAFTEKLKFEAPIALWSNNAMKHEGLANIWFSVFVGSALVVCASALSGVYYFGADVADAFTRSSCTFGLFDCHQSLSAEGPLITGVILLCASLALWLIRLSYRIYLSHRHLALNAREREAFTQTYLAFIKDGAMQESHAAVVLAAIFRPSQDGLVRDDDSGTLDLSAASIIAKALAGR